jgi:flagellum-specific peptidoglycan hydrolase FlgJ
MIYKKFIWVLALTIILASCGSHKKTVKYKKYTPKRHKESVVVIPKEDIDKAKEVFKKVKNKSVNPRQATLNYINNFAPLAIIEMKEYKIPASITLAQGIVESGSGLSRLSLKSNNHFGIKCHKGWTGDYVRHDDDKKNECFRKYSHPIGSFKDHSLFLKNRGRYSFLFKLKRDDYKAWAKGLKKAGYATDPKYPKKLIKIIEDYQLYRYDDEVLHHKRNKKDHVVVEETVAVKKDSISIKQEVKDPDVILNKSTYTVKKGETLYAISKKLGVTVEELKKWNNLDSNALSIGQELIIKK